MQASLSLTATKCPSLSVLKKALEAERLRGRGPLTRVPFKEGGPLQQTQCCVSVLLFSTLLGRSHCGLSNDGLWPAVLLDVA